MPSPDPMKLGAAADERRRTWRCSSTSHGATWYHTPERPTALHLGHYAEPFVTRDSAQR